MFSLAWGGDTPVGPLLGTVVALSGTDLESVFSLLAFPTINAKFFKRAIRRNAIQTKLRKLILIEDFEKCYKNEEYLLVMGKVLNLST